MDEFADRLRARPWVIIPSGAVEGHGRHLPVGVDIIEVEDLALRLAEQVGAIVAPTLTYGNCQITRRLSGTISIGFELVCELARQVLRGFAAQGAEKLILLSCHGGRAYMMALRQAALHLVDEFPWVLMLVVFDEEIPTPFLKELGIGDGDTHGGTIETSKVWAIDPGLVRQDRLPDAACPRYPAFRVFPDPSPYFAGVMGDPKKASPEIGRRLHQHRLSELVRILRDAERELSGRGAS